MTTLKDVDIAIQKGEFICVIGEVGCGKSSFLHAVAGNMIYVPKDILEREKDKTLEQDRLKEISEEVGKVKISKDKSPVKLIGGVALCEQKPWIENKTLRKVILLIKSMKRSDTMRQLRLVSLQAILLISLLVIKQRSVKEVSIFLEVSKQELLWQEQSTLMPKFFCSMTLSLPLTLKLERKYSTR